MFTRIVREIYRNFVMMSKNNLTSIIFVIN